MESKRKVGNSHAYTITIKIGFHSFNLTIIGKIFTKGSFEIKNK